MKSYFTALDKTDESLQYPALDNFEMENGIAFVHDIESSDRLPYHYNHADIMYAEIPWRHGYGIFNQRAGAWGRNYQHYLRRIAFFIENNSIYKPFVIVTGQQGLAYLPKPDTMYPIDLNGHEAIAAVYNLTCSLSGPDIKTYKTLLARLAECYDCIGDFCCGFGNSGKIFMEHGKAFVMSDINPRCIGYIAAHAKTWHENIQQK